MTLTLQTAQLFFGAILVFYASGLTLSLLLKERSGLIYPLTVMLSLIVFSFAAMIALDFGGVGGTHYVLAGQAELSETLLTHRWLLIQLPIILTVTALFILMAYKTRIHERHAKHYRWMVITCVFVSFLATITMAIESFI
jgi:hypothetical protein